MKRLVFYFLILIGIPFLIVSFLKVPSFNQEEIELKYLSNIMVRVKRVASGKVENVFLEDYVVHVVAGEMPAAFSKEALKAQSVASRTYVLKKINQSLEKDYDVVDTVSNQVYLDDEELQEKWGSKYTEYMNKIKTAVNETSMEYLEYDGEIIDALFFSTSNGYTEDSGVIFSNSLPYLKSVESSYDSEVSSVFMTDESFSLQEFYERLGLPYSDNLSVSIIEKSASNRVVRVLINDYEFTGREVYDKLKIRSLDFSMEQVNGNVIVHTKGYGHGVGMSQYGAYGMAKNGFSYKEILAHYYTGTNLKKLEI